MWYEASQGAREALQRWPQFSLLPAFVSPVWMWKYPAAAALAQWAAGHPVHPGAGDHASTAHRLYTAEEPGHACYYSKVKAPFADYKGGSNAIPIYLLV